MGPMASNLVDLDDDGAGDEGRKGEQVERGMDELASALLDWRRGGLEAEDGLHEGEEGDAHGDGVAGEEDDGLHDDVGPDVQAQEGDAQLGEDTGS